jgi:hypothetical protein
MYTADMIFDSCICDVVSLHFYESVTQFYTEVYVSQLIPFAIGYVCLRVPCLTNVTCSSQ